MVIDYNIHCILWNLLKIKSKWLCKYDKHNYMIYSRDYYKTEIIENNHKMTIIRTLEESEVYYKCYCCGKEYKVGDCIV